MNGKMWLWRLKRRAQANCGSRQSKRFRNPKRGLNASTRDHKFWASGMWRWVQRNPGAPKRSCTYRRREAPNRNTLQPVWGFGRCTHQNPQAEACATRHHSATSKLSAKGHSVSTHCESQRKPLRRAIAEISSARYLCELSVQMVSSFKKGTVQPARGIVTI